jgi:hypothetical protein
MDFDPIETYHRLLAEYTRLGYDEPRTALIADLWLERQRRITESNGEQHGNPSGDVPRSE